MNSLLLVIGTTTIYLFADFVFAYQLTVGRMFEPKKLVWPNKWFFGIALVLAVSSVWSMTTLAQSWQTVFRIIVLGFFILNYQFKFGKITIIGLSIFAVVGMFQMDLFNRGYGIHENETVFGMFGMSVLFSTVWPVRLAGILILSSSIARIPLAAIWIYSIFSFSKRVVVVTALASIVFVSIAYYSTPERLTISGVKSAAILRYDHITHNIDGDVLTSTYGDGRCGVTRPIELRLFGYGYGSYCYSTGQPTPHNMYELAVYEMGLLVIPLVFFLVMIGRKIPLKSLLPLLALGLVTDDLFRPNGIYIIALWLITTNVIGMHTSITHDDVMVEVRE